MNERMKERDCVPAIFLSIPVACYLVSYDIRYYMIPYHGDIHSFESTGSDSRYDARAQRPFHLATS